MSFFYEGVRRLDWGLGNPNHAAALIAMLMMAVWVLAYGNRKWGFWSALILFTILGVCLVQTFSRGGLLAAALGGIALAIFAPRPWPKVRIGAVLTALIVLTAYATLATAAERYASSWQGDASVLNRLEAWKHAPRMMLDAPGGWGLGQSQTAYMQWYQDVDREERFLNLASLHLTLLVEFGWPLRLAYLFLLLAGIALTFPGRKTRSLAPALGVWIAFLVAGTFTHFTGSWQVFVLPLLALAYALWIRWRSSQWPGRRAWMACAVGLVLAVALIFILTGQPKSPVIRGASDWVTLGTQKPSAWVLIAPKVLGANHGKTFRRHFTDVSDLPAWGFVNEPAPIPAAATIVLSGTVSPEQFQEVVQRQPRRILLINTSLFPEQVAAATTFEVEVIFGEFSRSPTLASWLRSNRAKILPGAGDFLPDWPAVFQEKLGNQ